MKKQMSISVILLAYQEEENLVVLLPKIIDVLESMQTEYEILIVDSPKSTDHTKELAEKYHATYMIQDYPGYGGAFRTGVEHAKKSHCLFLDSDGSHNPETIPAICEKYREGYDMVIGSRYVKGGVTNDARSSYIMSMILNTTMRIVIGVKARDISTSYRLYETEQLKQVQLERENYDVLQEVILKQKVNKRMQGEDFKIGEVPIVFNKRMYGDSKRQLFKFIRGYIVSVFLLIRLNFSTWMKYKKNKKTNRTK